jgi:hypothetical protein
MTKQSRYFSVERLREMAGVSSIAQRHASLMNRYYESALTTNNPLIGELFESYKAFKKRNFVSESQALNDYGVINYETLEMIRQHNNLCINGKEKYATTLCMADKIIRDLITDNYFVEGAIT